MRHHARRAGAATVAAAAAVALAAGSTGPASATAPTRAPAGPDLTAHSVGTHVTHLTLLTGDRVTVGRDGRVTGFRPAKGRERIPVRTQRLPNGHTLVLPSDAQRLIADGTVEQRLFDLAELREQANRTAQKKGLKVIVGYKGAATAAKAEVRSAGDTTVRRTLKALNADAVSTPKQDAADLWAALTSGKGGARTAASGISHVWLDGVRKATLDKSVKQIGADKAWAAGYDGKGVKIAVLDTGVDATHPDLKDQVIGEKNFTQSADAKDRYGHGTHVASTAAGTGAKSGGKFKGVAPGAKLLSGKVLGDEGYGDDSGIIAGMEWAAAEGADVVNLSLGGGDTPGVDPLEAQVDKLSADKGILFAISAGNDGSPGSVGSPGSADAALTVGAVDDDDKLADFSSQGPRVGDGAIKPDVTAPGVDITAAAAPGSVIEKEVGQNPEGYLTISGTSMAAPHVAGAAALLKQQHPEWKQPELKGALTGSTKPGKYTPFQQGSGRIAVDNALKQTVIADPVSVSFGTQQWPHTDDKPVTKKVTYKNLGKDDVTLDLTVTATDPKGRPAPAGFFTLGAKKVTVPAGGTASVDLTADTRPGDTVDGTYSAYIEAKGAGQSVRTAAAVDREVESYDVTLKTIGRDGRPTAHHDSSMSALTGEDKGLNLFPQGATAKVRVAKGTYLLDWSIHVDPDDIDKGTDWLLQPRLTVDRNMTVTLDARKAKPVDITVPDRDAKPVWGMPRYIYQGYESSPTNSSFKSLRTAHLGAEVPEGFGEQWLGTWTKGAGTRYDLFLGGRVKKLSTGYTKHLKRADFATVKVRTGASAPGRTGSLSVAGYLPEAGGISHIFEPRKLPRTTTVYATALGATRWGIDFDQYGDKDEEGAPAFEGTYEMDPRDFTAGRTYTETFNVGVFGPALNAADIGVFREGDRLGGRIPVVADGKGHEGWSAYSAAKSTLYRDGTKIAENDDPVSGGETFEVPAGDAEYRLTASVKRDPKVAAASSRVEASWTFRSKTTADRTRLPASTARFTPKLDLASRAPAGATQSVPVTVQGAAAGAGNLKSLAVYVSYDDGRTWKKVTVQGGKVAVKNPAKGEGVSLRARITDKDGNKSSVSIHDAYYGK
ncbi:S8 family serine peptidase [Streptomyces sp. NPDC093510]|uniref:S8 family serine peptidase n=1 Tax=Streptomyces sp. NPDC093510 TaxID=3155199 RepID=UPI003440F9A5